MDSYEAAENTSPSFSDDESRGTMPVKMEPPDSIVPLTNILNELVQLKYFLLTGPAELRTQDGIHRHTLPNKDQISCVVWKNVYFITGTDIVRCLSFRFEAFGREITDRKKFEEGIFSDLRNLKCDSDAVLEQPKSEFLDYLYRNNCVRTQKKQKIFYWFSVNHDRLFQDALERDLKKELGNKKSSTTPVRDPAISFQYDGSRTLHDQLPDIIEKFPRPLADLVDVSSVMSNLPSFPNQMMTMGQQFPPTMSYQMVPTAEFPVLMNQQPVLQSNGMPVYQQGQMAPDAMMLQRAQQSGNFVVPYQQQISHAAVQPIAQPPISLSVPPSNADFMLEDQTTQQIRKLTDTYSDFPLDYVEPVMSNQSQMLLNVDNMPSQQDFYYDEPNFNTAYIGPSYEDTQPSQYKAVQPQTQPQTQISDPAITYDNQQFQVVYQQDETGAFTSAMVPTSQITSLASMNPVLQPKKSISPRRQAIQPPQQRVPSTSRTSSPLKFSPKKSFTSAEGEKPSNVGSQHLVPSPLQAKKLSSKISKSNLKSTRTRVPMLSGRHEKNDYHSAAYFVPTPSESGCSEIGPFIEHDLPDTHSPSFRRSTPRTDAHIRDLQDSNRYTLKTNPVGRRAPEGLRMISNQPDDLYQNESPSVFDEITTNSVLEDDIAYSELGNDRTYLYSGSDPHLAGDDVGDWI